MHRITIRTVASLFLGLAALACPSLATSQQSKAPSKGIDTAIYGHGLNVPIKTASQVKKSSAMNTPYERRMVPIINKLRARSVANQDIAAFQQSKATIPNRPAAGASVPGLAENFPGFQSVPSVAAASANDQTSVYSAIEMDVNQDGKPDLVSVQADGNIYVLLNPGKGNFSDFKITSTNSAAVNIGVFYVFTNAIDVNGDGYPDLVAMDTYNNAAFVYINKKDGTFADPTETDFNFAGGASFRSSGGSIVALDTNGDKIPDLVAVTSTSGYDAAGNPEATLMLQVAQGNGDGTFGTPVEQDSVIAGANGSQQLYGEVLTADMNNDGKLDLVIPLGLYDQNYNQTTAIIVGLNTGKGTFSNLPTTVPTTGAANTIVYYTPGSDAVADLNGDGNLDVIFSSGTPGIYVALGNGDGTMQNPKMVLDQPGTAQSGAGGTVNFADVNGDGILDVISYSTGFTSIYLGKGNVTYNDTPLVQIVSGETASQEPMPADYNGDGQIDLAVVDINSQKIGFLAGDNGSFDGPSAIAPAEQPAQNFQTIAVGDFNGDGSPDIVAFRGFGSADSFNPDLTLGINNGKGQFTVTTALSGNVYSGAGAAGAEPFAVDLNGDGKLDLILDQYPYASSFSGPFVSLNNGDNTFAAPVQIQLGYSLSCPLSYLDVGDVNGDGKPDIVAAYGGDGSCNAYQPGNMVSGFFVMLNQGSGQFASTFTAYGYGLYIPKLVDLDGDGKLDLVLADSNNQLDLYYLYDLPGNGDGTFNFANAQTLLENTVVSAIIPGDYDGDGIQDIAVGFITQVDQNGNATFNTTGLNLMKGNGDFTFQLPVQYTPGTYPLSGFYADFNGDGRPDLALSQTTFEGYTDIQDGNFVTLVNLGGGAFAQQSALFTSESVLGTMFVADFNGDGALDALDSIGTVQPGTGGNIGGVSELFLNTGAVTVIITASSNTITQGSPVTLTATIAPTVSKNVPSGTATFSVNGAVIETIPLSNGAASITLTNLVVGADSILVGYSGDPNFNAVSASTPIMVTVAPLAPSFTLSSATPATLSVQQGQSAVASVVLSTNATFTGSVSFTCTGLPAESACTVNPASVQLNGAQTSTITVAIATTPPNNQYQAKSQQPGGLGPASPSWFDAAGGISLAGFLLLIPLRKRCPARALDLMLVMALAVGVCSGIVGCGGGGGDKYPGTTVGTSTLTITATSGTITQTATISLAVTK